LDEEATKRTKADTNNNNNNNNTANAPTTPPKPPPVAGWEICWTKTHKRWYYYNKKTMQHSYETPKEDNSKSQKNHNKEPHQTKPGS
jgi:hypothetical protein